MGDVIIGGARVNGATPLPVTLSGSGAGGEAHIGQVGGTTALVVVEKTRPNDTNAYAANDAINESASAGTNWTFAVGRIATGSGLIVGAFVWTDDVTWTARMELGLYSANPTAINDNAEATRLYANVATYLGTIVFPALSKHTANSTANDAAVSGINLPFKCAAGSSIFGILRTLDAVALPIALKKFSVGLGVVQD
jgi:hypothetical protein